MNLTFIMEIIPYNYMFFPSEHENCTKITQKLKIKVQDPLSIKQIFGNLRKHLVQIV